MHKRGSSKIHTGVSLVRVIVLISLIEPHEAAKTRGPAMRGRVALILLGNRSLGSYLLDRVKFEADRKEPRM